MAKSALGRGFGALMGASFSQSAKSESELAHRSPQSGESEMTARVEEAGVQNAVLKVPIDSVYPSPLQPRKIFDEKSLDELTESIREQGVLQPLVTRKTEQGYELIAGERRLRASKKAGLTEVPIIIRQAEDQVVLEWMLIENLQREDLNPIDEARGFEQLIRQFNLTQEAAAARVGKGRVAVANALRLLKLPQAVQFMVADGRLSVGHAKAILSLELMEDMQQMAEEVVVSGLSVRETEAMVSAKLSRTKSELALPETEVPQVKVELIHLKKIEDKLREKLGTQVKIRSTDGNKGNITIQFFNNEDLERLMELFSVRMD